MAVVPRATDVSLLRNRCRGAYRKLGHIRMEYLIKCYDACGGLPNNELRSAIYEIARRMQASGLYGSQSLYNIRFAVLKHFARMDQDLNRVDLGHWEKWLRSKGIRDLTSYLRFAEAA